MPRISSRLDVHSQEFRDNAQAMGTLVEELRREVSRVARGGSTLSVSIVDPASRRGRLLCWQQKPNFAAAP